jgi:hypothetical protein
MLSPRQMPSTLGQLSGTGGLGSDAFSGFGGFDPVTGIANVSFPPWSHFFTSTFQQESQFPD